MEAQRLRINEGDDGLGRQAVLAADSRDPIFSYSNPATVFSYSGDLCCHHTCLECCRRDVDVANLLGWYGTVIKHPSYPRQQVGEIVPRSVV